MKFSFRWWMAPVIGVGICAIANGTLIATSLMVRPQKVVERPYADSEHEDTRAAERDGFAAAGWKLDVAVDGSGCLLTLSGGVAEAGVVSIYRPDDVQADRRIPWPDLTLPLRVELPRRGAWSLLVELRDAGGVVVSRSLRLSRP